jgi:four helix bundle protein
MTIEKFEDLLVWQKSKEFVVRISLVFKDCKDYSFKDQIWRASISIMNNIAEGFERRGDKEFKNFLNISKGSSGEVRSMLSLAYDLKYIDLIQKISLSDSCVELSRMLMGLMRSIK